MSDSLSVDYSDLVAISQAVENADPVIARNMLEAVTNSVALVQHSAMEKVDVSTGTLRRSIAVDITPFMGRVGSNQPHALTREKGWPPFFAMPPPGSLLNWLRRNSIPTEAEYVIRRAIYRRGFPARPYLVPALEENQERINAEFEAANDRSLREIFGGR